jgi:hypothetical protein
MFTLKKSIATLGAVLLLLQGLPALTSGSAQAATWKPAISDVMSRPYPILMGNQFSSGNIDTTKLNWCAKNLDILVINKSGDLFADNGANSTLANQIHAINPKVKVLQYVNIMDVWQSQPTYTWMKNNNAFLYDDAGNIVHPYQSSYGTYRWAGDPLKTNWQDYYAQHCKDMVTQGMDGIFSDNWFRSNSQGWNINSARFGQLQQGWETMGQKTKSAIGNAILIGNSPAWSIYQSRDIAMIESRNAPNSSAFNQFLKDSDTAAGWGQATLDTIYWLWDGSTGYMSTYASILDFSLPACLLTDDIFGIPNNTTIMGIMDKVGKVGYPKAARYRANGILQRDFTAGKVLFNDTSATVTVSLPQGVYKNVDGNAVTNVSLAPFRGIVLKGSSVPVVQIPSAPTELAVASTAKNPTTGNTIVNLSWKDNSANETGFAIQLSTDPTNNFNTVQTTSSNANSLSLDIGKTFATYYIKVSAVNSAGNSPSTNTVDVKISQTIPLAPTNLTAAVNKSTTGNYIVNLNWTDNSDNEDNFEVYLSGTTNAITSTNANITAVNLDLGTSPTAGTYNYNVLASNIAGKSQPTNTGSIKIASVPSAPTNLALTSVTKGTTSGNYYVNLTWKDNATDETGYQILQATSANGPFSVIKTPAVNAAGYSVNIGPNTGTFYYQVVAVNAVGNSAPSNTLEAKVGTTTPAPLVPTAPTNLALTSITKGTTSGNYYVNLTWKDNATNETGYQILQATSANGPYSVIKTPAVNAAGYSVNIGPNTGTFYYQVVAVNAVGNSAPSNTLEAKVGTTVTPPVITPAPVPASPTNLTLNSVTRGVTSGSYYINLAWKDASTNETGFQILESVNSTAKYTVIKTPVANSGSYSVNIGSSPVKGTHYYQILAVNQNGNSQPSNTVSTVIK